MILPAFLSAVGLAQCPTAVPPNLGKTCELQDSRYVCLLSAVNKTVLSENTTYVARGVIFGNYTLSLGTIVVGGAGGSVISGQLTVSNNDAAVCSVKSPNRLVVTGSSAKHLTVDNFTATHDDVAVMVVGASKISNSIDVTGLLLSSTVTPTPANGFVLAAAHAFSSSEVQVQCTNKKILLQPYISDANITGNGCVPIDLGVLLAVYGRPYEVL
jgi:hypothetical protein